MCESVRRRSSSQQLLQNLLRVTTQRSQEDAEEVERERRRREREKRREEGSPWRPEPPQQDGHEEEEDEYQDQMKVLVLDEDEGYSDSTPQLQTEREDYGSGPPRPEWRLDPKDRNLHLRPALEPRPVSLVQKSPEKDRRTPPSRSADRTSWLTEETMNLLGQVGQREEKRSEVTQQKNTEEEEQEEKRELNFIQAEDVGEQLQEWSGDDLKPDQTVKTMSTYGPMSPTFKKLLIQFCPDDVNAPDFADTKCTVSQRHESMRSSALEKNLPPVSKTDNGRQQHTNRNQEIKPGDVLHKKNFWESRADAESAGKQKKEGCAGRTFQFVVTGHGKYEKVCESSSCSPAGQINEDL
ncbi:lymphocyte-specific protein 1-like isoform X2 [Sphaeramia orbicularis]|uniref:lymphocyte-specific protein 1-like isoform X2 n=1 Tax=Sphaeramia orbicularis TaxID=375764 RepID=UPI00117C1BED|nr:lymphocyte-specific protein 1-like isoform X2 [Sphaeramia orbicularis]